MQHKEAFFKGYQDQVFFRRTWSPDTTPKACIAIIHGVGSHSGGILNIVNPLVQEGYEVCAYDIRGHGRSEGDRAFINGFEQFRNDTFMFLNEITLDMPNVPVFLMGHSLGGVIALDYALHMHSSVKLQGLVLICPAIIPERIRQYLSNIPADTPNEAAYPEAPDFEQLTRDIHVIREFKRDPLRQHIKTAGLHRGTLAAVEAILQSPQKINVPLLIVQGLDDQIVPPENTRALFDLVPETVSKSYLGYSGMLHNPHDDIGREIVMRDISYWIQGV